jgi:hypothetical protein
MEHDTKNSVFALQGWNMTPNVYQLIAMQGRNKIHKVYQIIVRKEDDNIKCFFYKFIVKLEHCYNKLNYCNDGWTQNIFINAIQGLNMIHKTYQFIAQIELDPKSLIK